MPNRQDSSKGRQSVQREAWASYSERNRLKSALSDNVNHHRVFRGCNFSSVVGADASTKIKEAYYYAEEKSRP